MVNSNNYDLVTTTYDFANEVTATNRQHYINGAGNVKTLNATIANGYYYDQEGRKMETQESINGGPNVAISHLNYNEVGQLYTKRLHGINSTGQNPPANITLNTAGTTGTYIATNSIVLNQPFSTAVNGTFRAAIAQFVQGITYSYNERGWMTNENSPLFAMQLGYNSGSNPQYNGNISSQAWGTGLNKSYIYFYDRLNRLTAGGSNQGYNERSITYDQGGNIQTLSRLTTGNILLDSLSYTYTNNGLSNQINTINNQSTNATDMPIGVTTYNNYDANGNTVYDGRTAATLSYNILNLPRMLSSQTTSYYYDPNGNKLRRIAAGVATDYISGIEYDGTAAETLTFIQTEEGRAIPNGSTYNYEYNISDQLGSTRITFNTGTGAAQVTQTNDYYPFGMNIAMGTPANPPNNYLYNHKEMQANLDFDYGRRFYDPVVVRWGSVDRLAEKYYSMTPYQYAALNPIRNIDVNGDSVKVNYNNQNILYQNGKLYNGDGSEYKGAGTKLNKDGSVKRYKGFLGDAVSNLNSLGKSKAGAGELNALEGSKNVFTIKDAAQYNNGSNAFVPNNTRAAYAGELQSQGNSNFVLGGSGGTIYFNPNDSNFGTLPEVGGGTGFHPETNLGHELFHAWDADRGQLNDNMVGGLETSEWRASYYENQIRSQLGYPYRSEYGTKAGPVSILDTNGNPTNVTAPAPTP